MWEHLRVFLTLWLVLSATALPVPPQDDLAEDKHTEALDELRRVIQAVDSGAEERIHLRVPLKDREALVIIEIPKSTAAAKPAPATLHIPRVNSHTLDSDHADTFAAGEPEGTPENDPIHNTLQHDLTPLKTVTFGNSGFRGMLIFWVTVLIVVLPAAVIAHKLNLKKERVIDVEAAAGEAEQPQEENNQDNTEDNQETD
jgi:hypothetical protein